VLWEQTNGHGPRFVCRIDHPLEALQLWIEHCTVRNTALQAAARALAENVALAEKLAAWSREQGREVAAARIEAEAEREAHYFVQVHAMLEDIDEPERNGTAS
jgi:hypothetical protein